MVLRTIMIFPQFDNMKIIDEIRKKYDSLSELVRPHITLVFPFESELSNEQLRGIMEYKLQNIAPFRIKLHGISRQEDRFGNYLFLNVLEGTEQLSQIHDILYSDELEMFDMGIEYIPHMTIGKLETREKLDAAYESIKNNTDVFEAEVDIISVEMIGENEESIVIIEKKLER